MTERIVAQACRGRERLLDHPELSEHADPGSLCDTWLPLAQLAVAPEIVVELAGRAVGWVDATLCEEDAEHAEACIAAAAWGLACPGPRRMMLPDLELLKPAAPWPQMARALARVRITLAGGCAGGSVVFAVGLLAGLSSAGVRLASVTGALAGALLAAARLGSGR